MRSFPAATKLFLLYIIFNGILPACVYFLLGFTNGTITFGVRTAEAVQFLLLGVMFAFSMTMIFMFFGRCKFWHLAVFAVLWFVFVPYLLMGHDVGFSFFVVTTMPFLLMTAVLAWFVVRKLRFANAGNRS